MSPITSMAAFWLAHPTLQWILHLAFVKGGLGGFIGAVGVDIHTFLSWKSPDDTKTWSLKIAAFRWAQGAVYGATGGGVVGGLIG